MKFTTYVPEKPLTTKTKSDGSFEITFELDLKIKEYKGEIEVIPVNKKDFLEIKKEFTLNKENNFNFKENFEIL